MTMVPRSYENSLVEICAPDGRTVGTGVIINEAQVVTCAHVVAMACGLSPDAERDDLPTLLSIGVRRSFVDGRGSNPLPVGLVTFHGRLSGPPNTDIALLQLSTGRFLLTEPTHNVPSFADLGDNDSDPISVVGFPGDATESIGQAAHAAYVVTGRQPNSWVSLESKRSHGQEIRGGFSGAPAWSSLKGRIVGIITEADDARRTATLIPVECLKWGAVRLKIDNDVKKPLDARKQLTPVGWLRIILEYLVPRLHYFLTRKLAFVSDPPERLVLQEFLSELAADLKSKIEQKTYIPPPTKSVGPVPPRLRGRPFQQLIKEIAGVAEGGDAASAQISALSKRSRHVRRLVDVLMRSAEPLILLGEPGSGKSLTLQQASMLLAQQQAGRVIPSLILFVPLGRWKPVAHPDSAAVEDLVRSQCPLELEPYFDALEAASRLIVVFDGMDEMSREKYVEHTAALYKYALSRKDRVRTLFSCRIADFSPDFLHKRLVLLHFEISHVTAYLKQQFIFPVEVDNQLLNANTLARRICAEDMPVQAGSPFVLSLLCIYLQEKHTLPQKRVDLLEFYYTYAFERKRAETHQAEKPADQVRLFQLCGRIALAITQRNQGTDIGQEEVVRLLGHDSISAIEAARLAGLLQQSTTDEAVSLRFEHHRAQEYFTARCIAEEYPEFDWTGKLDLPR